MNLAHIHLLLNHFPTVGTIVALGLYIVALWSKSSELRRASLVVFFGIAMLSIPAYVSGNAAQEMIVKRPGVSEALIETHQSWALVALLFVELTGLFAWLALWQTRRTSAPANSTLMAVLVCSLITFGLMANAANIGGEITHPEIRDPATPEGTPGGFEILKGSYVATTLTAVPWVWPAAEALHFIGLTILFGVVLLVDLRMLGVLRGISFPSLHRLLPWAILAYAVNVATGMLFFVMAPQQYTTNPVFHWKLALILVAAANAMYFTLLDQPWAVSAEDEPPFTAKLCAGGAIAVWIGVIYCGHMLPFIGNAF